MKCKLLPACAAVVLICGTAAAQTVPPPEPGAAATPGQSNPDRSDPSTSTPSTVNPSPQDAISQESSSQSSDPDMSTAADHRPKVGREARMGGISAGSIVQNPAGEPIGRVKDIVPNANTGDPAYVVISTRSGSTAVPYAVIAPMYQDGHIVLDRSRLESAPRVNDSQLREDDSGAKWKKEADRYWESRKPPNLR
ncbi:MAG: PRC-barrel domain-containing protein [Steroidobacteraceae bacterium]